tara:strand:+ start:1239 stop:3296 length:2058 start_codon:yes stop_codon:yes gene_type:complete
MKTEIGGDRLGSGNKQEVSLKNYSRSTHDLSYIWRSSMSSGTLVPFMSEVGLPGDSFDVKLDCDVKTLPTVGPLFGSYKVQLDVFQCPVRLYQGKLHMNMLNIGLDMSEVILPQVKLQGMWKNVGRGDNQQVNSSAIYSYLNMRGIGRHESNGTDGEVKRLFNALPYLSYWDIYKNYYANKQEESGVVIHAEDLQNNFATKVATWIVDGVDSYNEYNVYVNAETIDNSDQGTAEPPEITLSILCEFEGAGLSYGEPEVNGLLIDVNGTNVALNTIFNVFTVIDSGTIGDGNFQVICSGYNGPRNASDVIEGNFTDVPNVEEVGQGSPQLTRFNLENIDNMRMDILEAVRQTTAFEIDASTYAPYGLGLRKSGENYYATANQEGLGIKTYQSDLFNNWISTEWIDGTNGINEVTAVDTSSGTFTIDSLNLANKVYTMLNRIAISGGSYDDWLDATYTHERAKSCENPVYQGSLIKELGFEEVVSLTEGITPGGEAQPLGTLAGRGRLTGKDKGGTVKIKVDEPSYIMGIVSITPRVDYSQGNKWDTNLKTMNDLHKPQLDAIGYQDLVTDQMAWFDTYIDNNGSVVYKSAGKQPAWINYMTNVNQTRGNFANGDSNITGQMFMTLNRRYENGGGNLGITDLTTYIDPSKYNNIFAETQVDAQNFWVQISNKITARRKMSAKVIPNL